MHKLTTNLAENIQYLRSQLDRCGDIEFIEWSASLYLIYCKNLIDVQQLHQQVFQPLYENLERNDVTSIEDFTSLKDSISPTSSLVLSEDADEMIDRILNGSLALLINNQSKALLIDLANVTFRKVEKPSNESNIRGPNHAFVETLHTNLSLMRYILPHPSFKVEMMQIGKYSHTKIAIVYIDDVVNDTALQQVRERLSRIQIDAILGSGYLEELIEDHPFSLFPQMKNTERPDTLAAALLEGRIGVMGDGTPYQLIVPTEFFMFLHAAEDHYERFYIATALRLIRILCLLIALLLPAFYIAVTTFHMEMLPTEFAISIAEQREGVPFSAFFEAMIMELFLEIMREAGVRLPKAIGASVSIVGVLVIGDAAIISGIASPAMVIVVALTGIASFAIPSFNIAISLRLLRFLMMIISSALGLFGLMIGILAVIIHMNSIRSFGVPYLNVLSAPRPDSFKDFIARFPHRFLKTRPSPYSKGDNTRYKRK
ncbi:spore germination protein [Paenibacillus sedimenti]|uniref:Spore germination protein n=1 Tax=Paenibacillus sedimenti TaxID=2770274 RepID=A0A926KTT8_9BACL|nr:spore germination protein [Paenibacillus sedimenti]MBD0384077.1 spore germination protein [Paenibacillus sedimenti]